jgi:hypothetical protein
MKKRAKNPEARQDPRIEIRTMFDPVWIVGNGQTKVRCLRVTGGAAVGVLGLVFEGRKSEVPIHTNDPPKLLLPPFVMKSSPWYERLFTRVPWVEIRTIRANINFEVDRFVRMVREHS